MTGLIKSAIILSAGFGKRMLPLTQIKPNALIKDLEYTQLSRSTSVTKAIQAQARKLIQSTENAGFELDFGDLDLV